MPYILDRSKGGSGSQAKKSPESKQPAPSSKPPRKLPLSDLPRPVLIGGGIALLVVVLVSLWFMFGVGPEDSASVANDANSATAAAPSAPASTSAASTASPPIVTAPATSGTANDGAANPTGTSAPLTTSSPAAASSSPGTSATSTAPGSAPGVGPAGGNAMNPAEVEGLPPQRGGAGAGSTWKPSDPPGKAYTHGPASDP